MNIRPQIEDPQGVQDAKAGSILRAVKTIVDSITGRGSGQTQIKTLGNNASFYGVINKLNEVIARLQSVPNPPLVSGSMSGSGTGSSTPISGSGTVTSVGQTVPEEFVIAGSPITTSGTFVITKATQVANTVWAGPVSGANAPPTFRSIVISDLPTTTWTAPAADIGTGTPVNIFALGLSGTGGTVYNAGAATLYIIDADANQSAALSIRGGGANRWLLRRAASTNDFSIYNFGTAASALTIASADSTATFAGPVTLSAALNYGGVTLTNAVTGTGKMVLDTNSTMGAFTLGGTVSGGGNQINNVIIGASTPLAGSFTTGTFSGTITKNNTAATVSQFFSSTGSTTAIAYGLVTNTSGNILWGVENSAGGGLISGDTAYDAVLRGASGMSFSCDDGTSLHGRISSVGAWQMPHYGAGTATFDASGNITSVSDEEIKDRIEPYTASLAEIVALSQAGATIRHHYREDSGLDTEYEYAGFNATVVEKILPHAVGRMNTGRFHIQGIPVKGHRTFNSAPIVASLVNAVAELSRRCDTAHI